MNTRRKTSGRNRRRTRRHPLRNTRTSPFEERTKGTRKQGEKNASRHKRPPAVRRVVLPELSGKERKRLRGLAHHMKPVVIVGGNGITKAVIHAVDEALAARELIKVRLHEPEDKKAMASDLARRAGAVLLGLVGHTAILYRPRQDDED